MQNNEDNRCPTCGYEVETIFSHVDINCEHDMAEQEIRKLEREAYEAPSR